MKKTAIVFLLIFFKSNAQDFSVIEKNRFETTEDYKKAEPEILKLADYLLRTSTKPYLRIDNSFALESAFISYPKLSKKKIYKKAYETLAKYCADEKNNLKPNKTLKKLIETMEKT